jgi:sugar phosphate isomerase/epimerase
MAVFKEGKMKLSTTTADLSGYAKNRAEQLALFEGTGFRIFDLSLYTINSPGSLYLEKNDEWKKEIEAVGIMAEKLGFSFCLCHGPSGQFYNGEEERQNLILTTKRAIEACAMLGIKDIVVHSVTYPEITPTQFKKENKKFNEMFFDDMEKHGVNVLIENSTRKNSRDYYLRFGMEMKEYIEFVGHPMLYACWDTGHAHMEGVDQYESIVTLGNLLRGLHIADNLGNADSHTAPFFGTCNFDAVMQGLLDIQYAGTFNYECENVVFPQNSWPHKRKPWFYKGEEVKTLHQIPLHIKKKAVALCYEIGMHILTSYNCFEE